MIEDDPVSGRLVELALAGERSCAFSVCWAQSLAEGLKRLSECEPDVVVLDLGLPDSKGLDTFLKVSEVAREAPVVIFTESTDESLATEAVRRGAQDYLVKGPVETYLLVRALRYAVERRRARARVEQMKEEFLHNVSHELKNPLTAVDQAVALLIDGVTGPLQPSQRKFLEIAQRNVAHLRLMIEDLLEVTRAQTGKLSVEPRRTLLPELVAETVASQRLAAAAKGLCLAEDPRDGLPPVHADPVRVRQVVINFLDNAMKFTPSGGNIRVWCGISKADPSKAEVSVTDSGCGIDEESVRRVFDRLYQVPRRGYDASRKGLGLGLYICKQIVERHGGRIWAESAPGKGSSFRFTVPLFSLESLLEPVLIHEGRPVGSLALLWVEVYPPDHILPEQTARAAFLEALNALRQNVHHYDLVLPEMSPPGLEGLVFIAAPIHAKSVPNMILRLQAVLSRLHSFRVHALTPRISHAMLEFQVQAGGPAVLAEAARRIEALVTEKVGRRVRV
ncbi:MAG: ATP-binding protein [Elusimicrobiota bacterium]